MVQSSPRGVDELSGAKRHLYQWVHKLLEVLLGKVSDSALSSLSTLTFSVLARTRAQTNSNG